MGEGTVRQRIVEMLATGPCTALEISGRIGVPEKEVAGHLGHIDRSLRHAGGRLLVTPAFCRDCGFEFRDRQRKTKPGKCPHCRSTFLEEPRFAVRLPGHAG